MSKLQRDVQILNNKQRFIIEVVEEKIILRNVKRIKIIEILKAKGYRKYSEFTQIKSTKAQPPVKKANQEGDEDEN